MRQGMVRDLTPEERERFGAGKPPWCPDCIGDERCLLHEPIGFYPSDDPMTSRLDEVRERLRRPPAWGPNEQGDVMVDMTVDAYEADLDALVAAAREDMVEPDCGDPGCSCS